MTETLDIATIHVYTMFTLLMNALALFCILNYVKMLKRSWNDEKQYIREVQNLQGRVDYYKNLVIEYRRAKAKLKGDNV